MYPIVWDALVVIVNRDNPIMNISLEQLVGVYTGEVNNWNQMGGQDRPIALGAESLGIAGKMVEVLFGDRPELLEIVLGIQVVLVDLRGRHFHQPCRRTGGCDVGGNLGSRKPIKRGLGC